MKRFLILILLLTSWSIASHAQDNFTTFVLIRHAEKANDGTRDPALTAEGVARAERLKSLFEKSEVTAIYSSPFKRTKATVAPLAKALSLEINEYNPRGTDFLKDIMKQHKGGLVIVSGHSNTTPFVANALLGEQKFEQLDESDYSNIFIVTVSEIGKGTVTLLKY